MKNSSKIYICTISTADSEPGDYSLAALKTVRDCVIIAPSIAEAEALVPEEEFLQRIILTKSWIMADKRESYSGDFYIVDVIFESPVSLEDESIVYLIRGESFAEIEEIAREEAGDTFQCIQSIETLPYEILGV